MQAHGSAKALLDNGLVFCLRDRDEILSEAYATLFTTRISRWRLLLAKSIMDEGTERQHLKQ